jgi:hypothetical protein
MGPENLEFIGPKWHSLHLLPFQGPKGLDFQRPHPFQWPLQWFCPHQIITDFWFGITFCEVGFFV